MAKTVVEAFNTFASVVRPTDAQQEAITSRRQTAHNYLNGAFANSNMPLVSSKLIGSAARSTVIRPLDDVDVLAVFRHANVWDTYRTDSRRFLYRVRDALNNYRVEVVGARGQAVRLFYKQNPNVDIAPVFARKGGGYLLPNGGGGWIATNPDVHATFIADRNAQLDQNLLRIIRFVKRWNNVHSRRLKSFHLEIITQATFSSLGLNSREALRLFFEQAAHHLTIDDPAGLGGDLSSYLTTNARQAIVDNLKSATQHAVTALEREASGDHAGAIQQWRIVLGDEFPTFG